jgi:hypothetical protein
LEQISHGEGNGQDMKHAWKKRGMCTEGQRPTGRLTCRWEDNIKMDLRAIGWSSIDMMNVAQDRDQWWALVNMVMNLWVPRNVG